jgi:hypothetical protein
MKATVVSSGLLLVSSNNALAIELFASPPDVSSSFMLVGFGNDDCAIFAIALAVLEAGRSFSFFDFLKNKNGTADFKRWKIHLIL